MSSNDKWTEHTQQCTEAINAYCRVVELQLKMVEQGASPELRGPIGETVSSALMGLSREVEFLNFLRNPQQGGEPRREFRGD